MPLTPEDQLRVDQAEREVAAQGPAKLLSRDATEAQKLGPFTVACTILNRTIDQGSGIFVAPAIVLKATNSPGVALLLWTFSAFVGISGLLVWLELGLSIPRFQVPDEASARGDGKYTSVPRNGGEKNYLEYIYHSPRFRTTCIYGVVFIIFGNLCGNAVAFGIYVLQAADIDIHNNAPLARGLAVVVLTAACALHAAWRKGGLLVSNCLATIKVLMLLCIIGIGFASAAGASFGNNSSQEASKTAKEANFSVHKSFAHASGDFASYANALIFTIYPFSGYYQPFYIMSEVSEPKKKFAKTTLSTMIFVSVLYILVNVAYLCVVSLGHEIDGELDMATLFFRKVFGNDTAPRVMSGMIALSIVGNIVIMTFTASRVKQEIAKEGVLPFSKFWAQSNDTLYSWFRRKFGGLRSSSEDGQSPMPALFLHWLFTMLLIASTAGLAPADAYQVLVSLYFYCIVAMGGFLTASGLLYLRWFKGKEWTDNVGFKPWGGPAAAIFLSLTYGFLLVAVFVPPSANSPFSHDYQWYAIPVVGLCSAVVGYIYYLGFTKLYPRLRQQVLVVEREPIIVRQGGKPNGEWVQILEIIDFWWSARDPDSKA
ncbi:MAG: hypothetical protein Q9202_003959 [Teloschistes flavicans]